MYWLGFIFADGYITERKCGQGVLGIKLGKGDKKHLIKFMQDIGTNKPIYDIRAKTKYGEIESSCIMICSDKIFNRLQCLGCVKNKSLVLEIWKEIRNSGLFSHFVRGYFDGDGSVYRRKQNNGYKDYNFLGVTINGTKEVLDSISEFIIFDGKNPVYKDCRHPNKNIYSFRISSNKRIRRFKDIIYHDCGDTFLKRKKDIFDAYFIDKQKGIDHR